LLERRQPSTLEIVSSFRVSGLLALAGLGSAAACGAQREPTVHPAEFERKTPQPGVSVARAPTAERVDDVQDSGASGTERETESETESETKSETDAADMTDWRARFLELVRDGGPMDEAKREFEKRCGALLKQDPKKLPHWPDWGQAPTFPGFASEPIDHEWAPTTLSHLKRDVAEGLPLARIVRLECRSRGCILIYLVDPRLSTPVGRGVEWSGVMRYDVYEKDRGLWFVLLYRHPADLPRLGARRVRSYGASRCDSGTCACACARTPGGRGGCLGFGGCNTARDEWESCRSYRELVKDWERWSK
jgi:hypothetical protein